VLKTNMYKVLQSAIVEKDVENAYRTALLKAFGFIGAWFESKHGTDGVLFAKDYKDHPINLIMLLECKYDADFTQRSAILKVLIQALYYLKKFEDYGEDLPSVILIGDINECFCLHSNELKEYLEHDLDWTIAPSSAASKNPALLKEMFADETISPYVFTLDEEFDFEKVVEKAVELSSEIVNFVRITEKNINRVFNDFVQNVLYHKKITKELANKLVNVFLSVIINPEENYLHPNKKQTLVTKDLGNVRVDRNKFQAFFRHFQRDYSPKEKDRLASICDRLIEDTTRRFQGEFFTPTEWVIEAHKMIEEQFGENWKEEYVVWDPAWGTGNLTRDFKFKELYASTLNASDIGIAEQRGYNPEAIKFQYDFLNDPYEDLPEGLRNTIESGHKIIVFMNPPYARAGDTKTAGLAATQIATKMKSLGIDGTAQLYTQFLFRIMDIKESFNVPELNIAVYSKPLFLSGPSFSKFRHVFLNKFKYLSGMLFRGSEFSDVADSWAISFTLWKQGQTSDLIEFKHNVKIKDSDGKICTDSIKSVYNTDNVIPLNKWLSGVGDKERTVYSLSLNTPLKLNERSSGKIKAPAKHLGYVVNKANNIYHNRMICLGSIDLYGQGHAGAYASKDNIFHIVSAFSARNLVSANWVNDKDEYLAPDTGHLDYEQWNRDCLIYSLFNNNSNQSSLRNIEYKDKNWNIENQWFWMSNKEMIELANDHCFDEAYQDARAFGPDRFVYNQIQGLELSNDANVVLAMAKELTIASFEFRHMMHQEHPEYHLNTWDAGWYQIKKILKEYMPDNLKDFFKAYKAFEDRMRGGVYKFGFLK